MVEVSVGRLPEGAEHPAEGGGEAHDEGARDGPEDCLRRGNVGGLGCEHDVHVGGMDATKDRLHGVLQKKKPRDQ